MWRKRGAMVRMSENESDVVGGAAFFSFLDSRFTNTVRLMGQHVLFPSSCLAAFNI